MFSRAVSGNKRGSERRCRPVANVARTEMPRERGGTRRSRRPDGSTIVSRGDPTGQRKAWPTARLVDQQGSVAHHYYIDVPPEQSVN